MISSKAEALGIIFPNSYDSLVPDLVSERLMASIPFASRYRMCDFMISSMVHCGIDNISILVRKNYHSLLDHLGNGREWDLARKNGGLNIVPPFAQKQIKVFSGRIEALESIRGYLIKQTEKYVILSDANIAVNFDFNALLDAHIKSGADVTMVYRKQEIPQSLIRQSTAGMDLYYALGINGDRVSKIYINPKESGEMNFSLNIYVIDRELLIRMVDEAYLHGDVYFVRDILEKKIDQLDVRTVISKRICGFSKRKTSMHFSPETRSIQRFVMITRLVISMVQRQRMSWLLTVVSSKVKSRTVFCSEASRLEKVQRSRTAC